MSIEASMVKHAIHFNGDEIVRLTRDRSDDGLIAGNCGLVWGVYDLDPPLYEASFVTEAGEFVDVMFGADEVVELMEPENVPRAAMVRLEALRKMLDSGKGKPR